MIPFIVLLGVYGGLHLLPRLGLDPTALRASRARMRVALAAMFTLTGISHFAATEAMVVMVPEVLPLRREAVYLTGAAEFAGAAGLLAPPPLRRVAGLGLAALLVAVFPANVNVAVHNLQVDLVPGSPVYQWGRLLLQPLLLWLVLWASELAPRRSSSRTAAAVPGPARART